MGVRRGVLGQNGLDGAIGRGPGSDGELIGRIGLQDDAGLVELDIGAGGRDGDLGRGSASIWILGCRGGGG